MVLTSRNLVFVDVKSAFGCPHLQIWRIKKKWNKYKRKKRNKGKKRKKQKKNKGAFIFCRWRTNQNCICPRKDWDIRRICVNTSSKFDVAIIEEEGMHSKDQLTLSFAAWPSLLKKKNINKKKVINHQI